MLLRLEGSDNLQHVSRPPCFWTKMRKKKYCICYRTPNFTVHFYFEHEEHMGEEQGVYYLEILWLNNSSSTFFKKTQMSLKHLRTQVSAPAEPRERNKRWFPAHGALLRSRGEGGPGWLRAHPVGAHLQTAEGGTRVPLHRDRYSPRKPAQNTRGGTGRWLRPPQGPWTVSPQRGAGPPNGRGSPTARTVPGAHHVCLIWSMPP